MSKVNFKRFKEKLNILLAEENINIAIVDAELVYVAPKIARYSTGETLQERETEKTGGIGIGAHIHLGMTMDAPYVFFKE